MNFTKGDFAYGKSTCENKWSEVVLSMQNAVKPKRFVTFYLENPLLCESVIVLSAPSYSRLKKEQGPFKVYVSGNIVYAVAGDAGC